MPFIMRKLKMSGPDESLPIHQALLFLALFLRRFTRAFFAQAYRPACHLTLLCAALRQRGHALHELVWHV
jgi:hypothetical protein